MSRTAALAAFAQLPAGTFRATFAGRRYVVSKTPVANGRGWKLVAEEPGGRDYISANIYLLASGARILPCEMPRAKVEAFLTGVRPD